MTCQILKTVWHLMSWSCDIQLGLHLVLFLTFWYWFSPSLSFICLTYSMRLLEHLIKPLNQKFLAKIRPQISVYNFEFSLISNLFVTSKIEFSNPPIPQFSNLKCCLKSKEPYITPFWWCINSYLLLWQIL